MRIVPHIAAFSDTYSPEIRLLTAPCIAGLLPAAITSASPTPTITVLKRTDPEYLVPLWRAYRPPPKYADTKDFLQEKILQAQDRLEARFAQIDAEFAAMRRKLGGAL